jgi:hypothetical protein
VWVVNELWTPERSNRDLWSPDGAFHAFMGRGRIRNPDGSIAWEEAH